ncbi:restriction endonuclease [Brevundimonas sp. DWR2-3-1b1]|uniref:restriction endonuclease n=1 Tax=unclassified Brevundimonas TaxID=2622653 RepID=UPI003CF7F4FC
MAKADLLRARDALDALVRKSDTRESEVSAVVFEILQAAGYAQGQQEARLPETSMRLDATFEARIEDKTERVGVEVRGMRGNVSGQTVYRAQDLVRKDLLDRVLIVSLGGYSQLARERAEEGLLGKVDLLDARDLRIWINKRIAIEDEANLPIPSILKRALRAMALHLATAPAEMGEVEWRMMEQLLGEVFEGLGFDTEVTQSAKDGGYDVRLKDRDAKVYLVEVKHWQTKAGSGVVKRFVEVNAKGGSAAGLILSTGGFADCIFEGLIELQNTAIHLGDRSKVAALCKAFYRAETQLWQSDDDLPALLLGGTTRLTEPPPKLAAPSDLATAI